MIVGGLGLRVLHALQVGGNSEKYVRRDEFSAQSRIVKGEGTADDQRLVLYRKMRRNKDLLAYAGFDEVQDKQMAWGFVDANRGS